MGCVRLHVNVLQLNKVKHSVSDCASQTSGARYLRLQVVPILGGIGPDAPIGAVSLSTARLGCKE